MEHKKILVVYNIYGKMFDNIEMWINHLEDITKQKYPSFKIAISGCKISDSSKLKLIEFKNKHNNISINFINEDLPVNPSFNLTVRKCTEEFGLFDGYLYVASDVKFGNDYNVIDKLSYVHFNSNSAMTYALVDKDHGLDGIYEDCWEELSKLLETDHFCVNIGRTANIHVMLFDKEIYTKYNNKIMPDIFASHCSEGTFSYIAASLGKKFIIHNKDIILTHIGMADGHGGFLNEINWNHTIAWKHLYKSSIPAEQRLLSNEAKECGFGYQETRGMLIHDENMYDENENHKEPQKLFGFLKKSIYLSDEELNYQDIKYNFIK